jgi:limonene-1,2-epoxide hydrolase
VTDVSLFEAARSETAARIARFFAALGRLDFDAVGAFFAPEGVYQDVPAPEMDARGPAAVAHKLRTALEGLDRMELRFSRVVASGTCVTSERVEVWHFPTGETASLPVLCLHELRGAEVLVWREYWNLPTLTAQLPASWIEVIARRSRTGP